MKLPQITDARLFEIANRVGGLPSANEIVRMAEELAERRTAEDDGNAARIRAETDTWMLLGEALAPLRQLLEQIAKNTRPPAF